jgi:radical SAM-linked protein
VKLRVRATKLGKVRFTSHRDAARMWERALRRAGLPVAFTEGFTPRPKISFGLALPTGAESIAEYVDIEIRNDAADVDPEPLPERLSAALPNGFDVLNFCN